ncbi:acetyltransferase [Tothia fuscella]|uniref:Acetyltransferase n=1 Tax=Tothia fuscella TaxID=1048955 RepID=A0A9P4TV39_9PEZI|nr:acetyltransferase [Tothia fuscella]
MAEELRFCPPIQILSNEKVKLIRLLQSACHASTYFELSSSHPEIYAHMTPGPFATEEEFVEFFIEGMSNTFDEMLTYAIIDKTQPPSAEDADGELAGMISYMFTSSTHSSTEIGFVIILPPYQRTHVTTNAVGLMLQRALNTPQQGGYGLQRVVWNASSNGFNYEGTLRWSRCAPGGRVIGKVGNGRTARKRDNDQDVWRDSFILSHCWYDWDSVGSAKVQAAMDR